MSMNPPRWAGAADAFEQAAAFRGLITQEHRDELLAMGCVEPGTELGIEEDRRDMILLSPHKNEESAPGTWGHLVPARNWKRLTVSDREELGAERLITLAELKKLVDRIAELEDVVVNLVKRATA